MSFGYSTVFRAQKLDECLALEMCFGLWQCLCSVYGGLVNNYHFSKRKCWTLETSKVHQCAWDPQPGVLFCTPPLKIQALFPFQTHSKVLPPFNVIIGTVVTLTQYMGEGLHTLQSLQFFPAKAL